MVVSSSKETKFVIFTSFCWNEWMFHAEECYFPFIQILCLFKHCNGIKVHSVNSNLLNIKQIFSIGWKLPTSTHNAIDLWFNYSPLVELSQVSLF